MAWDLEGRAALITGGASGIGAELARQLTRKGMRVGLIDVDERAARHDRARAPRPRSPTCATPRR